MVHKKNHIRDAKARNPALVGRGGIPTILSGPPGNDKGAYDAQRPIEIGTRPRDLPGRYRDHPLALHGGQWWHISARGKSEAILAVPLGGDGGRTRHTVIVAGSQRSANIGRPGSARAPGQPQLLRQSDNIR